MHHVKDKTCSARPSGEKAAQDLDTSTQAALFILWRFEKMRKAGKEDFGGRMDYARSLREYVLRLQSGKKRLTEEDRIVLLKLSSTPPNPGIIPIFSTVIKASVAGAIIGGFGGMSLGVIIWGISGFPFGAYSGAALLAFLFGLIGAWDTACEPEELRFARYLKHEVYEKHRDAILG